MAKRTERSVRIETKPVPENFRGYREGGLGGIYGNERGHYQAKQKAGNTIVPLANETQHDEPIVPRPSDDKPEFKPQARDMRMSTEIKRNGDLVIPHYQREWQRLNEKGLTHDLIHFAVERALKRPGFTSVAGEAMRQPEGIWTVGDYDQDGWPEPVRIEETIVDALEIAGIREGKISENFWDALASIAHKQNIAVPEVTPEMLAAIAAELDLLTVKALDADPQIYHLPKHRSD